MQIVPVILCGGSGTRLWPLSRESYPKQFVDLGDGSTLCYQPLYRKYTENQSTYIPIGARHRLRNPGIIPLVMIEIQSGSYLGEDDIVRLQDVYGR